MADVRSLTRNLTLATMMAALIGLGVAVGGGVAGMQVEAAEKPLNGEMASIVRGGRLYDDWLKETGAPDPLTPHPSYPADGKSAGDAKATWRCKECHGYDYLGKDGAYGKGPRATGVKGIGGMAGAPLDRIVAVLKDDTHRYGKLMIEQDLTDIARFVSRGQINMTKHIDSAGRAVNPDTRMGQVLFNTVCANCHGSDGQKIRRHRAIGHIARNDPWKALHEILNGHPGEVMPPLRAFGEPLVVGILGYAQALPTEHSLTSVVRGGRLYDSWFAETGLKPPAKAHPKYPSSSPFTQNVAQTWRCVRCHGWDYRGQTGAYSKGSSYYTGFRGIRNAIGMNPDDIVAILKDKTHGYGSLLSAADLKDLANFVSDGQVDMDSFVDRRTRAALGNADKHVAFYTTICARCHGDDGREISSIRALGNVATTNPEMTVHMILNGHPAKEMPALRALDPNIIADILAYIQTLPTERMR